LFRWTCKHFGHPKPSALKRNTRVRQNQSIMPSGCRMAIYVSYDNQSRKYLVKSSHLLHNHPTGADEYATYSSERQPRGALQQQAMTLLEQGAKPMLVASKLNQAGLKTTPRDIYNIKQKMKFKGITCYFHV